MLILTDDISRKTLMLADFQRDNELEDWIENRFDLSQIDMHEAVEAVKARDNTRLEFYGLSILQITNLRPRYIPDINRLAVDLEANGITFAEESTLADMVSALYHVDSARAEKYL